MELSEDQLRDVFETLDSEGMGFVSMDQLISFAQNAGFTVCMPLGLHRHTGASAVLSECRAV